MYNSYINNWFVPTKKKKNVVKNIFNLSGWNIVLYLFYFFIFERVLIFVV